jgi:hypothetical protein
MFLSIRNVCSPKVLCKTVSQRAYEGMNTNAIYLNALYIMKKKEFNNRLNLGKKVISNLQQNRLHGGTDSIATVTYVIITTIKIATEYITNPRICVGDITKETCPDPQPVDTTQVTTFPPTCMDTCPSV